MSKLKIFTDEHIGKDIVEQLQRRGVEVLRCEDVGMKSVEDTRLLEYATRTVMFCSQWMMMSHDYTTNGYMPGGIIAVFSTHQWHNSEASKVLALLSYFAQNGLILLRMALAHWRKTYTANSCT